MPEGLSGMLVKAALVLGLITLGVVVAQRLLIGFMAQRPEDYAGRAPAFELREALDGPLIATGVIYGPTGRVATRFVAEMNGTWGAEGGVLAESFVYDTGRRQERAWRIVPGDDGRFTATASDVEGVGLGRVSGDSAVLRYRLILPPEAGGWVLDVTDWLYLAPDGVIVNRSQFRRFGILLGELVGTIRPAEAGRP